MNESFVIQFQSEDVPDDGYLREEAERRLRSLADEDDDIVGASVVVERLEQKTTPHLFRARVVAFVRPENIAATEKSDSARGALKGALTALERQVRAKREKLGRPWERPDR